MSVPVPDQQLERQERRLEKLTLLAAPFFLLAVSTLFTALVEEVQTEPLGGTFVVVGVAVAWLVGLLALYPRRARHPALLVVFTAGMLVIFVVLVSRGPVYALFAFMGYLYSLAFLPGRWRYVGVLLTAVIHVTGIFGGPQAMTGSLIAPAAVLVLVIAVMTTGFSHMGDIAFRQRDQHRAMADALAEANRRLEATLRENEGLHAQLVAQAREAGVLDERQRMAGEIHDTIAQGLTGIITQVQAATNAADRPEDWRRHLDNAARIARDSLAEARRSVQAVGPAALEAARLPDALAEVAADWSGLHDVPVEVHTTGTTRPLHPEVEGTLLRTAQEALANVAKHAAAARVGLTLSYMEDVVTLDVLDDGVGFVPDQVRPGGTGGDPRTGGFGLRAMRQRVDRLAGQLTIESEPGGGTVVSASVPAIPPEAAARAAEAREATHD